MRKRSIGLLAVLLVLGFTLVGCPTDGGGDDDGITKISTAEEFNAIRNRLDGHYVLEEDIDLSGYENWDPIGTFQPASEDPEDAETPDPAKVFSGTFDGNGHTISNITINRPSDMAVGLFGCVLGTNNKQ
jgi:predicted small secreted protein